MLAGRWPLSVTDSGVAWGLKPYDLAIYGRARSVGETIPVVWSQLCPVTRPPALAKRPAVAAVWGNRRAGGPLEIAARIAEHLSGRFRSPWVIAPLGGRVCGRQARFTGWLHGRSSEDHGLSAPGRR